MVASVLLMVCLVAPAVFGAPISDDAAATVVGDRNAAAAASSNNAPVVAASTAATAPVTQAAGTPPPSNSVAVAPAGGASGSSQPNVCQQGDQKYQVGDTFMSAMFKMQCVAGGTVKAVACVSNGVTVPIGTSIQQNQHTYNCYENPTGAYTFYVTDTNDLGLGVIQNNQFIKQSPKPYGQTGQNF